LLVTTSAHRRCSDCSRRRKNAFCCLYWLARVRYSSWTAAELVLVGCFYPTCLICGKSLLRAVESPMRSFVWNSHRRKPACCRYARRRNRLEALLLIVQLTDDQMLQTACRDAVNQGHFAISPFGESGTSLFGIMNAVPRRRKCPEPGVRWADLIGFAP